MKKFACCFLLFSLFTALLTGCGTVPTPPTDGGTVPPISDPSAPSEETTTDPSVPTEPVMPTLPDDAINVVTDWGVSAAAGAGIANGLLLYQKISSLAKGSTVYFPEGVYELDLPLYLSGKKNIRVVGYKATLINTRATNTAAAQSPTDDPAVPAAMRDATATSGMVWVEGSQGVTVEGITFRYAAPTSISGTVIAKSGNTVDLLITDGSALTGEEYVMAINAYNSDGISTWEQYASSHFPVQKLSDTSLRVSGTDTGSLKIGDAVCLRMSLSSNYIFTVFNSSDITLRDVTMQNSFNGGVLIEHRTVNATFERVRVQSPNKDALMSLNADALHLTGLGGELIIRDCYFERGGDDFLNVSGAAGKITSITGNKLSVTLSWGADGRWAAVGDTVEFYDPATLALLGTAKVTAASGLDLTFDTLPAGVTTATILSNKTLHPKVTIENSHFRYNRARALLLQTDDVTVKNCSFLGTTLPAILAAPDLATWYEVSPVRGIRITDCSFTDCGRGASGVIVFATNHDRHGTAAAAPIHADISVTSCRFSCSVPALYAVSCRSLSFTDNHTDEVGGGVVLFLISCRDVTYDSALSDSAYLQSTTGVTKK